MGLTLNLVYPLSEMTLRLQRGVGSVSHTMVKELSTEPAAFHELFERGDHIDAHFRLPSSRIFIVKWRAAAQSKQWQSPTVEGDSTTQPEPRKSPATAGTNVTMSQLELEEEAKATVFHDVLQVVPIAVRHL